MPPFRQSGVPLRARRFIAASTLAVLTLALTPAGPARAGAPSPGAGLPAGRYPAGRYIVTLHPGTPSPGLLARRHAGRAPDRVFTRAVRGFAMSLSARAAEALARDPAVASVEQDHLVRATETQASPPWGLDRIDQRDLPLDGGYSTTSAGAGVTAYVIDTGIRTSHADFSGRASAGFDAIDDGRNGQDCHGHGTHVAGTIGGETYGVAKDVSLVGVRVLNCAGEGLTSEVVAGIDWVTANAVHPAVANMSLGGPLSPAMNAAVQASIDAGITYVAAAGNENADACDSSPGALEAAITVSATTSSDARASYANHGSCVDLFAPGSGIRSAGIASDTDDAVMSGTSMAAPHVAGVVARFLSTDPDATPAASTSALLVGATADKVTGAGTGSPNVLLYGELLPTADGVPLTVSTSGTGEGSVSSAPSGIACGSVCEASFEAGTPLTLTATAAAGSTFTGWGGACAGTGLCVLTMSDEQVVTATFTRTTPILRDLGFEKGPSNPYWTTDGGAQITSSGERTGSYAAAMCGSNDCDEAVSQTITVPDDVQTATLTYAYRGVTNENGDECYDGLLVGAYGSGQSYKLHCNDLATGGWRAGSLDLTAFLQAREGQQVLIFVNTQTDTVNSTRFTVDDLNLRIATADDASAPDASLRGSPLAPFQKARTVVLSWTGSDDEGPVASYDVAYRRARFDGGFGARTTWRHATVLTGATFTGSAGYTYCFAVRARDVFGNVGAFSGERCTALPLDDRSLSETGSWTDATSEAAYLGTYSRASTTGKMLSRSATAKRVALVATTCARCGTVDVYLGSTRLRRVSLVSATTKRTRLLSVATLSSARSGTLRIKVVSSGEPVIVEGVGISRV